MRYSNIQTRKAAHVISFICAACFVIYSSLYTYLFQSELIANEQYFYSQGITTYNPYLGTFIITSLLLLLGLLISHFISFPIRFKALAWLPSCYFLGLICCLRFDNQCSEQVSFPLLPLILIPIVYIIALYFCHIYPDHNNEHQISSAYYSPNLLLLVCFFVLTVRIGNSADTQHHELRVSRLLQEGDSERALSCMHKLAPTPRLTQYKVYALTQQNSLGELLFSFPLTLGSENMIASRQDTSRVFMPEKSIYNLIGYAPSKAKPISTNRFLQLAYERDTTQNNRIAELMLTAYLLDKDLITFAKYYEEIYDSTNIAPQHFQEAAVLYNHKYHTTDLHTPDTQIETDYRDFMFLKNTRKKQLFKHYYCRNMFGGTYWYYYFFTKE